MIEVKVRLATHSDTFEEGDEIYLARAQMPDGTVVVEPITITEITEQNSNRGPITEPIHYSYKSAAWRSATGVTSSFTFASTDEAYVPNFKTDLLVPDPDGITALCYEQIGTAVTVTILVADNDPAAAVEKVSEALRSVTLESDEPSTRPAYDRTEHEFEMDGKLIAASVPNWHSLLNRLAHGPRVTAEGCLPVHEVQYEIMKARAEHEAESKLSRPRRARPPGSKNKKKAEANAAT